MMIYYVYMMYIYIYDIDIIYPYHFLGVQKKPQVWQSDTIFHGQAAHHHKNESRQHPIGPRIDRHGDPRWDLVAFFGAKGIDLWLRSVFFLTADVDGLMVDE